MITLKFLPLAIPAAIAGMAIVTAFKPVPSKAYLTPYATSVLALDKLKTIDYFRLSERRSAEGLTVDLAPQSTFALHKWFGSPAYTSETQDVYEIAGTSDGIRAPQRVIFYYTPDPSSNYELKASSVWIPANLLKR